MNEKKYSKKKVLILWVVFLFAAAGFYSLFVPDEAAVPTAADSAWEPVYRGETGKNQVAFAINVDWGEDYIPGFLETFAAHDIETTFFLTGRWVTEFPDVAKTIKAAGMEIGNHGYNHKSPNDMSYDENVQDIVNAEDAIQQNLGIKTSLFAPASGEREDQVLQAASELGYRTILWSADTIDWQKPSVDTIILRVKEDLCDGAIILMHPTENTLSALPALIELIEEQGYRIVPISELIKVE